MNRAEQIAEALTKAHHSAGFLRNELGEAFKANITEKATPEQMALEILLLELRETAAKLHNTLERLLP